MGEFHNLNTWFPTTYRGGFSRSPKHPSELGTSSTSTLRSGAQHSRPPDSTSLHSPKTMPVTIARINHYLNSLYIIHFISRKAGPLHFLGTSGRNRAPTHYNECISGELLILADDATRDGSQRGMVVKLTQISTTPKSMAGYEKYVIIALLTFFLNSVI